MKVREKIIRTKDLCVGYTGKQGESVVMNNINLTACNGELVALIGRNGSGKSTLLRSIVGLQNPLNGLVFLNGNQLNSFTRSELTRTISFTSTEPIEINNIRVYEAVALGRFPYTNWLGALTEYDREIVAESLELTGLTSLAERKIDRLSDGERQRVLIARSLTQDTDLLVMDEPTAFLDLPSRYSIVSLLRKLSHDKGKCIIYSTHDLDTALNETDKIWLMMKQSVCQGAPEDLVIDRSLAKTFESPSLSFNLSSGSFSFKRNPKGSVALEGAGYIKKWTEKALIRGDFRIDSEAEYKIKISDSDGVTRWLVTHPDGKNSLLDTVYDLINYLTEVVDSERR